MRSIVSGKQQPCDPSARYRHRGRTSVSTAAPAAHSHIAVMSAPLSHALRTRTRARAPSVCRAKRPSQGSEKRFFDDVDPEGVIMQRALNATAAIECLVGQRPNVSTYCPPPTCSEQGCSCAQPAAAAFIVIHPLRQHVVNVREMWYACMRDSARAMPCKPPRLRRSC